MSADKTILILAANPADTSRLPLSEEVREIEECLALSENRDRFTVVSYQGVREHDLRRALLKHKPHLVHFSGHGTGAQGLVIEDDVGQAKFVTGDALARLFRLCPSIDCVLMNACYSEVQATAIGKHINYVVGMTAAIGDRTAIAFATGFYDALGYGRSIPEAYEFGLSAIDLKNLDETVIPILKNRPGIQDVIRDSKAESQALVAEKLELELLTSEDNKSDTFLDTEYKRKDRSHPNLSEGPEGLIPLESPFYVERMEIEKDCYETVVKPGALIRIKAPRQMGKTSLLIRILSHARSQGLKTIQLNFQMAETQTLNNLDEFLQWFCSSVTEELGLENRLANSWEDARGIMQRCQQYFERYILAMLNHPIVIGLDEVDRIFEYPEIATDFFGMLRVFHEKGKSDQLWGKLHLVIVHSKEVYIPLSINRLPFNVGLGLELRELNKNEIDFLIKQHSLELTLQQKKQLIDFVGGHPYLLRTALYQLVRNRMTLSKFLSVASVEGGFYSEHLRYLLRHFMNAKTEEKLVHSFRKVLQTSQPVDIDITEAFKLHSLGLVKYKENGVVPSCELYRQYFKSRLRNESDAM